MESYVDIIKDIVLKNAPLDKYIIFLFGSRAAGNSHALSDIDVGFYGEESFPVLIKGEIESRIEDYIVSLHVDLMTSPR